MLFHAKHRPRIAAGEVTVSFRLWKRPHVRADKTYATGFGDIAVDEVDLLPAALISDEDARLAGCRDAAEVWQLAGGHTKTDVQPDTMLYRVQFRFLGKDRSP